MTVEIKEEYLKFLDKLRLSGDTNMMCAAPVLANSFPELNIAQAGEVLTHWMRTFNGRVRSP